MLPLESVAMPVASEACGVRTTESFWGANPAWAGAQQTRAQAINTKGTKRMRLSLSVSTASA